jgi:hypothetical protein
MKNSVFWDVIPGSPLWKLIIVSEEHVTFIFRFEELAMQKSSMKEAASKALLLQCQIPED